MEILSLLFAFLFVSSLAAEDLIAPPDVAPPGEIPDITVVKSGGCVDIYGVSRCTIYKARGYCSSFLILQEKCAKTCTRCADKELRGGCVDESKYCQKYYLDGLCQDEEKRLQCKKTCRWCDEDIKDQPELESYEVKCGAPAAPLQYLYSHRIIGGDDVEYGSIPWQAVIYYSPTNNNNNNQQQQILICGASIINRQYLLTAAHCFKQGKSAGDYFVYLGKYHRDPLIFDKGNTKVKLDEIIIHPNYNNSNQDSDIALIRLETTIAYSTFIRPVCLPTKSTDLYIGRMALVSGFGVTDVATRATDRVLQQVDVKMIDPAKCNKWLGKHFGNSYQITDNMFCAGHAEGTKDSCQGDSGGPLIVQKGSQQYLAGVVSWGIGCGYAKKPGIYVKVQNYLDWIKEKSSISS